MLLNTEAELAKEREKSLKKFDEVTYLSSNPNEGEIKNQDEHETPKEDLKECLVKNHSMVVDVENQLELSKKNITDLEARCQTLASENNTLENNVKEMLKRQTDYESEIDALRQKISKISAEKDSLQTALLETEIARHDGDNAKSQEVRGKDLKICSLEANIETLQVTLNVRDGEIKSKKEELKQLKALHEEKIVVMSNEIEDLTNRNSFLQNESEKLANLNSQRLLQMRECQKMNDDLSDRLDKSHTVIEDLESQLGISSEKIVELEGRSQILTSQYEILEQKANDHIEKIQALTDENVALESQLNSEVKDHHSVKSKLEAMSKEKSDLEKSIPALLETSELVRDLRVTVADLEEDLEEKRQAVRHLQMTNKSLQKEIKSMPTAATSSSPPPSPTTPVFVPNQVVTEKQLDETYPVTDVTLRYLKNVIFKFLTSPETEAKQMTRAVATLLDFTSEEEKMLYEYLEWKVSWFGVTKPKLIP